MNNAARISSSIQANDATLWLGRRIAAIWLSAWLGMVALVGLFSVVMADSWSNVRAASPEGYAKAASLAGEPLVKELLKFQAAEAGRAMLESWGWTQLALGGGLFAFLLLFSNAGKRQLALALALLADAVLIKFALIPNVDQFSRQRITAETATRLAEMNSRYELANTSFLVSQSVTFALGLILLFLLMRRSRSSRRAAGF
jgi:hypothetical protein